MEAHIRDEVQGINATPARARVGVRCKSERAAPMSICAKATSSSEIFQERLGQSLGVRFWGRCDNALELLVVAAALTVADKVIHKCAAVAPPVGTISLHVVLVCRVQQAAFS